jgi:uncharacterized protein YoxC
MAPLETALVTLVIIWTLIFVVVAIAMVILLVGLKRALDKINKILDQGEDMARGLGAVGKATAGGLAGLLVKAAGDRLKNSSKKR